MSFSILHTLIKINTDMERDSIRYGAERLDKELLLQFLNSSSPEEKLQENLVYHDVKRALQARPSAENIAAQIVYLLSIHGCDVNVCDELGRVALLSYLEDAEELSLEVIQAFCRCGSDLLRKDQNGEDCLSYVLGSPTIPGAVRELVLQYVPGLWKAVESDDAMSVRRLVNQWCTVRVAKDATSVVELAFSKGTENIIRVISGIGPSMDLAHGVIAGDVQFVREMLEAKKKVNINLRNLSDSGATPLFYALCNNDVAMVDLLLDNGARLDILMQRNNEDIPLYFAALSHRPVIDTSLLTHAIPTSPAVDQLFCKGRNVLFHCIEMDVDIGVFEEVLRQSPARLLTQKVQRNMDARELAETLGKTGYITVIDKVVWECWTEADLIKNRKILVLHSYSHLPCPALTQTIEDSSEKLDTCLSSTASQYIQEYEDEMLGFVDAVKDGDVFMVKEKLYSKNGSSRGFEGCFADSRLKGDGQPLLHKAVLRREARVSQIIAETLVYVKKQKVDSIRDQYFRTALHYAYGMEDGNQLISLLEDLGASEFAMDKDGRSPLAFKDRRGQKEMNDLLQFQRLQMIDKGEPDPWSVPLPLPIMGYISKCLHAHHGTSHHDRDNSLIDSDYDLMQIKENGDDNSVKNDNDFAADERTYSETNPYNKSKQKAVTGVDTDTGDKSWVNLCKSKSDSSFSKSHYHGNAREGSDEEETETQSSSEDTDIEEGEEEYDADHSDNSSVEDLSTANRYCIIL